MGRHKKVTEFDELFGQFDSVIDDGNQPLGKIIQLAADEAKPCIECGHFPRIHIINFKDKLKHPKCVYLDCEGCGECDGEWYATKEEALAVWNEKNKDGVAKDPSVKDGYDFIHDMMKDIKIPD